MTKRYHYLESGLPNVWLANGFTKVKTNYGPGVSIHNLESLHKAIATTIAKKPRLTGAEVRFLRKAMALSQRGLGQLLGVSDQSVALWEKKGRLPKTADRLLRLIYTEHDSGNVPIRSFIDHLNDLDATAVAEIIAEESPDGDWHARLAA